MHRVDTSGATDDNRFTDGDPTAGIAATMVDADFMNAIQEEIVAIIEAAGITLNKESTTQLKDALEIMLAQWTPDATTAVAGLLKIATEALALAGTDDTTAMTPATTKATVDACRASDEDVATGTSTTKFPNVAQFITAISSIVTVGNVFTDKFMTATGDREITIAAHTTIPMYVGDDILAWSAAEDTVLNVEDVWGNDLVNATDYNVFLCYSDESFSFAISTSQTAPTGFTTANSRRIGGFHTICVDYGTIADHPLSGLVAGDILPPSVWCLTHMPTCDPSGMTYEDVLGFWVDIYLQSGTGYDTKSVYNAEHTASRIWDLHAEDMMCVGKTFLTDSEFAYAAEGSNQGTAIVGASDKTYVGGHSDTAGQRMVSNCGCEEMCGYLWQWLDHPSANGSSGWGSNGTGKGGLYGSFFVLRGGGSWSDSSYCGSRSRNASGSRLNVDTYHGGRGRAWSRKTW